MLLPLPNELLLRPTIGDIVHSIIAPQIGPLNPRKGLGIAVSCLIGPAVNAFCML